MKQLTAQCRLTLGGASVLLAVIMPLFGRWFLSWMASDPFHLVLNSLLPAAPGFLEARCSIGWVGGTLAFGSFILWPILRRGSGWQQQIACVFYLLLATEALLLTLAVARSLPGQ